MHPPRSTGQCPECDSELSRRDRETICTDCGLVVDESRIDPGPEWRTFEDADGEQRRRTGPPLSRARHDRGFSTRIGRDRGAPPRRRRRMARLRRQHRRSRTASKADRNRMYGMMEIRRLVDQLSLTDSFRDDACVLFEAGQDAGLLHGRTIEGMAAATVYAVCRTADVSRMVEEVTAVAQASSDELTVAYAALNQELGLDTGPIDPREYLPRFADQLDLDPAIERRATEFAAIVVDRTLAGGRAPSGVAAACLYTAAREHGADVTQQQAADVAGVAPATLRSTYQDICDAAMGEGGATTAKADGD
ncbi:transcription initiation factor IIB [Halorhabdus salina]|uniref:transcription initiation factor IIB n=1 Tax=Halorhabdus salina TaxID=2750670 RepID=UPI0015EEA172|nr:transcription initiation factor IIB family protein [Halorhabdus salina]